MDSGFCGKCKEPRGIYGTTPEQQTNMSESTREMKSIKPYVLFHSGPFSQWHMSSFRVDGVTYNCCEQYMMAEKARLFKNEGILEQILRAVAPGKQKALGRKVRGFKEHVWKTNCLRIVTEGNLHKFSQNAELKEKLMATGDRTMAEASPKDRIWGIGLHASDERAQDMSTWRGANLLGIALMTVREMLREEKEGAEKKTTHQSTIDLKSSDAERASEAVEEERDSTKAKEKRRPRSSRGRGNSNKGNKPRRRSRKSGKAGKNEWL
uniref:NADAR domain-containing protein n=1 Tax=Lotharella oceanica TaxID=641309 RepID=A0A7S2U3E3_9EUKA|mmetsp:Transcript_6317/g.12579  ORF Transcript_6317/g.12579 Transcript_6317/m.12579 type:complete len:266 (+) Transcript_6317:2-799(+)